MKFVKYQALGNDYLVYSDHKPFSLSSKEISRVCDRHYGIGSDGILVLDFLAEKKIQLRIFNPDGSEAEKSGNGLRIFSRYLWDTNIVQNELFEIVTLGGLVQSQVLQNGRIIEIKMGPANFSSKSVGINIASERAIKFPIDLNGKEVEINAVSMGNPHCVIFCSDITPEIAKYLGPQIETHPLFINRTNVQFVNVIDRNNIQIEIWERGAGYTLSSGTSSCAAASVCKLYDYCDENICVHMPGGDIDIHVDADFNVSMRGPVFRIGSFDLYEQFFYE